MLVTCREGDPYLKGDPYLMIMNDSGAVAGGTVR